MIRRSLFWAAFPWVLPQALWLRKTAPRFSGANGQNSGQVGVGKLCSVLAIGDSVIAGVGADSFERALVGQLASNLSERRACSVDWTALGKIGATAKTVAEDLVPLIPNRIFDLVVLSVGVNDVTGLTGLRAYEEQLHALVEKLHTHSPSATIVLNGLPPMHHFPLLPQPLRSVIGLRSRLLEEVVDRTANRHE